MARKAAGYATAKHLTKQTHVIASYACLYVNSWTWLCMSVTVLSAVHWNKW